MLAMLLAVFRDDHCSSQTGSLSTCAPPGGDLTGLRRLLLDALEGISFLSDEVSQLREENERLQSDCAACSLVSRVVQLGSVLWTCQFEEASPSLVTVSWTLRLLSRLVRRVDATSLFRRVKGDRRAKVGPKGAPRRRSTPLVS
ncbi:hypothetical protein MRX96_011366 [Rhipicephalus microplus]